MRRCLAILAVLVSVSGCAGLADPFMREGTYSATGVNDDNLRAMVVNPVDLEQGTGAHDTLGFSAVDPVIRLRQDKVKELPSSTLSTVGNTSGSGGQGSGGGVSQ